VEKLLAKLPVEQSNKITHLSVVHAKPTPPALVDFIKRRGDELREVIFFEEGVRHGSLSVDLASHLNGLKARFFTYPDQFVGHGTVAELEKSFGWTDEAFLAAFSEGL
jgi:deoxyxylulose-5-phosphate synthase